MIEFKNCSSFTPVRFSDELYSAAIQYFNDEIGLDIENDYVKEHTEELIFCYSHNKSVIDFDVWTHYEDLLRERLSFDEFCFINKSFDGDILEIEEKNDKVIFFLKKTLFQFRLDQEGERNLCLFNR